MFTIRQATISDAPQFSPLLSQLGYPMSLKMIQERLRIYTSQPNYIVYVAELENKIVGFIAIMFYELFNIDGRKAHIAGIVVDESYRKEGIGAALINSAEAYARENGCIYMDLTSGLRRASAGTHEFYKKLGYTNEGHLAKVYLRKKL